VVEKAKLDAAKAALEEGPVNPDRFRANWQHLKWFKELLPGSQGRQGRNLALTV